jgi:hypothetical protein
MITAIKRLLRLRHLLTFNAVSNDRAAAVGATRGKLMNGALERIENVFSVRHDHGKALSYSL